MKREATFLISDSRMINKISFRFFNPKDKYCTEKRFFNFYRYYCEDFTTHNVSLVYRKFGPITVRFRRERRVRRLNACATVKRVCSLSIAIAITHRHNIAGYTCTRHGWCLGGRKFTADMSDSVLLSNGFAPFFVDQVRRIWKSLFYEYLKLHRSLRLNRLLPLRIRFNNDNPRSVTNSYINQQ